MLSRSYLQRMRKMNFAGAFARKTELLDHIDEQQAEIEYFKRRIDAAVLDADQWRQVATLTQYRLQGQLDALREHAEALVKAVEKIAITTDDSDSHHDALLAIDDFRAAYPKESREWVN